MPALTGGDSASPKINEYSGKKVWAIYVAGATYHIWTHAEVKQLGSHGIKGVLPIVVPPQDSEWWLENAGYATLENLVREAKAWGVPQGSPLCLDLEENQTARMNNLNDVFDGWAVATRTHGYRTWTYGGKTALLQDHYGFRWLAEWPDVTPSTPELPSGFSGWQYANRNDLGIDFDIFEAGRDYMTPDLKVVVLEAPSVKSHSETASSVAGTDSAESLPTLTPVTDAGGGEKSDMTPSPANSKETNEAADQTDVAPGVVRVLGPPGYDSNSSIVPKGGTMNAIGHLILGALAIGGVIALAVLHDLSGASAVVDILGIAGVSLGIGAATNSTP